MQTLEQWLDSTADHRGKLISYGMAVSVDIDRLIQCESDAENLLDDAKCFLTQEQARAVLLMKDRYPDFTSRERAIQEKAHVATLQRIVDGLGVTAKTLSNRRFAIMNQSRRSV